MPKTAAVTVTGKVGPGKTLTAQLFTDVVSLTFNIARNTIDINLGDRVVNIDYDNTATVTYTISGANATVTISS